MDDKTLNSLDGSATYQEVSEEVKTRQIEINRKEYKDAIRTLIIRHESAKESAKRAQARADKARNKLAELVDGGMQGFLTISEEYKETLNNQDGESFAIKRITRKKWQST
ncbi:unnamed protein product [marine sediment metagenome]|uniref:Uncharacterized protein n=1 Tax=marine sediment metagenome TaxID=412755 RepID=X1V836_9ZZZZ